MKKIFTTLILMLTVNSIFSQDTIYYDSNWKKTKLIPASKYYKVIEIDKNDKTKLTEKTYFKSNQIKSDISYYLNKKRREGKSTFWYETGEVKNEIFYDKGKINGEFLSYWKNGNLKRKDFFKKGKFKKGFCWNEKGEEIKHYKYEVPPKFLGKKNSLNNYINKNIKYPSFSKQNKIGGKVLVQFTVAIDGSIKNIIIKKGVIFEIDEEVKRIIKNMPKWSPGLMDGKPIEVKQKISINFNPNK